MTFREELTNLINKYSLENKSNTPDFLLAEYLENCLFNFDKITKKKYKFNKKVKNDQEEKEAYNVVRFRKSNI